ncbi:glycogen-debranching protein [Marichromatium purpuratum 984]|uniref:Glycogen-debranching protein n=1 Tax=Marichromatium purpuratum 984 TaxID=765910 RepID=W0E315_MARPU|nr:glycogen debranching protein GlgX [Marichromatium purpuratum]AHF03903.1 glycogen-debranching protein [Marichromatium purpuratum 984]
MTRHKSSVQPGVWDNTGATPMEGGVNFCVFSRYAESIELLLFDQADGTEPDEVIALDPRVNRTFFFWHVFVEDLPDGTYYNWRVRGSCDTRDTGCRLDGDKALLDPWATTVSDLLWDRATACRPGDNTATAMRAQVVRDRYDWEGDHPLHIPLNASVIYEMHVGGFTRHPSSGVVHPGSFLGVIEKIPYLQSLGITHVELMPVMAFDTQDVPPATAARGLENFWGYSTHSYFAPHPGFAVDVSQARDEFRNLVKALHRAGIGVIMDVVFNHTAEGGQDGPTISFKALGNEMYYHLDFIDRRRYRDYTGCGNTLNCNHPIVTRFLIDSLLYWTREMHVDGFRFDLASALARGEDGNPQYHAPVLWAIELSPSLNRVHIIAEAWDAVGLYQVGDFPGYRWAEWNGRYRDVIRGFVRGDPGLVAEVATRIAGSSDLYESRARLPTNSINFVSCHDGFSLYDLVSYDHKHNEANGEDNRDGHDHNLSWNCGVEGPTDDPAILALRRRQARNFIAILMLSQGVPMLHAGDELLRTKQGNNNTYCQNNPLGWIDWRMHDDSAAMLDFVRAMIALRRRHPALCRNRFLTGERAPGHALPDIRWHGVGLEQPNWDAPGNHALAFTLDGLEEGESPLHVMLNMGNEPLEFALPPIAGMTWYLALDTAREPWVFDPGAQPPIERPRLEVEAHGVVVLEGFFH